MSSLLREREGIRWNAHRGRIERDCIRSSAAVAAVVVEEIISIFTRRRVNDQSSLYVRFCADAVTWRISFIGSDLVFWSCL